MENQPFTLATKIVCIMFIAFVGIMLLGPCIPEPCIPEPRVKKLETIALQDRLLAAVMAYHSITGDYPPDCDVSGGKGDPNQSMGVLLGYLTGANAPYPEKVRRIAEATRFYLGDTPDALRRDAYGHLMMYFRDKGVGGRPLILSAGPDGDFGFKDAKKRTDNIRSDARE